VTDCLYERSIGRVTKAVHGPRSIKPDPDFERGLAEHLRETYTTDALLTLYARFVNGENDFDHRMRRAVWRAAIRRLGHMVSIGPAAAFRNPETIEIGDGVHIGHQTYIQGRAGGRCVIGDGVWIGPQSYFDARDLIIEDHVGWGPGAKVVCSAHAGLPLDVPIIQTDLQIRPVRVEAWADVGTNSVILSGVTVGRGSIIGAGAVITKNVPPFAVVVGVPARFLRWREGYDPESRA